VLCVGLCTGEGAAATRARGHRAAVGEFAPGPVGMRARAAQPSVAGPAPLPRHRQRGHADVVLRPAVVGLSLPAPQHLPSRQVPVPKRSFAKKLFTEKRNL